jgi:hypothetical protein
MIIDIGSNTDTHIDISDNYMANQELRGRKREENGI